MFQMIFLVSILIFVVFIQISFCLNPMSTSITSFSASNPLLTSSLSRRYLATNTNIGSLLMSGSRSGTQPTIVAIPLYIRNNLSKYPSIFELLSTNSNSFPQNDQKIRKTSEIQPNVLEGINLLTKSLYENPKPNDFVSNFSTHRQRTPTQKPTKYNIREEQQKIIRNKDQNKYETESNDSLDFSSPQKTQWTSQMINTPNRFSNENPFSRPAQRYPIEDERKQISPEFESVSNLFSKNRYNDIQNNEQKATDNQEFGPHSETFNRNHQNYLPSGASNEEREAHRNSATEKSSFSPQTSYSSENSEENPHFRNSDSNNRDDNDYKNYDNKYQNQENNEYEAQNKYNDFQYRSPIHIRTYGRSIQSNQFTTPTNRFTLRPSVLRQNYENTYVPSKPSMGSSYVPISSDDESSISSNNYNNNFQPMVASNAYNSQANPSNNGPDSEVNGYAVTPSVYNTETQSIPPNTNYMKTESKSQFSSYSNPNYSSDYSTPEDIDCYDNNSNDHKSTHSSQSIKSQNIGAEIDTKNNENYETEDLDPSKLDLKIVHLPISLLRRLIGSGDISLPSYQ